MALFDFDNTPSLQIPLASSATAFPACSTAHSLRNARAEMLDVDAVQ